MKDESRKLCCYIVNCREPQLTSCTLYKIMFPTNMDVCLKPFQQHSLAKAFYCATLLESSLFHILLSRHNLDVTKQWQWKSDLSEANPDVEFWLSVCICTACKPCKDTLQTYFLLTTKERQEKEKLSPVSFSI